MQVRPCGETSQLEPEDRSSSRRWFPVPLRRISSVSTFWCSSSSILAARVVDDQRDRLAGFVRRRRKRSHYAGAKLARAKVKRQQAMRGRVGQHHVLALCGERAPQGRHQAGLAHPSGQRKHCQHRGPHLSRACRRDGWELRPGMLKNTLQREPSRRNPFARVLQRVPGQRFETQRRQGPCASVVRGRAGAV